jgi:O-phospho-L-seryl-tRNASec:L-selenocysteinyl-tRNA synthase
MTIEYFLGQLRMMDSNNFHGNIGVGEREGRVYSSLVAQRHYQLSHGIGRSGDIAEVQPKAAGSSILYKLTNSLAQHAIELSGFSSLKKSLVVPMATGMTLTLSLLTLKQSRPNAKYVLWPRIDQKSCFKCILTAGLKPIIIPTLLNGDEIVTNIDFLKETIQSISSTDEILCV